MDAERSRTLVATAYGVALLMLLVAVTDVVSRILPVRLDDTAWRMGSLGVITLSIPTLVLALLLAAVTAWYLQHRLVLRALAGLSVAASLLMVATLPFFAMDVLELRRLVQPEARPSFYLAMGRAALTVAFAAALVGWMGYAAWRVSSSRRSSRVKEKAQAGKRASGMLAGRAG